MSVAKRICEAIDKLVQRDYEAALIPTSIAIDATASQIHPLKKNNEAYKDWLHDNLWLITKVGMGNVSITDSFRFEYDHPRVPCDADGLCSLEQILYHVVRCSLLHGAKLPRNLRFGEPGITTWEDSALVLSGGLIYGMVAAVVVSSVNDDQTAPDRYRITVLGRTKSLNDLWGNTEALLELFEPADPA
jgi:hypothetical protein